MKRLGLIALFLMLCGCVAKPSVVPSQTNEVRLRFSGVILEIGRDDDDRYNAIVQEIQLDSGATLVECFKWDGHVVDTHTWGSSSEDRTMTLYLAHVEGVDWRGNGFAHLPENIDGSVKTTVGPGFNADYQRLYETRGRIVRRSSESLTWSISATADKILAESP